MSTLSIHSRELRKVFALADGRTKAAVDGISLDIAEGERVGFIGPNGAGKTTLLQILAGIAERTTGVLDVHGKVTAIFTLGIGLREDLTGRENILVEGDLHGRSRGETEGLVDEIVEFAELGEFIDRPVRTYSTGMKARLAFSSIVHIEPEILIIDEALSVGDSRFATKAARKMRELTQRGRILILVSHSMGAIEDMCTRCVWLDDGKVARDGLPRDVTRAYLDHVRTHDENLLAERFRHELHAEAILEDWSVAELCLRGRDGRVASTAITGDPAKLEFRIQAPAVSAFSASLKLDRLDGLFVRGWHQGLLTTGPLGQATVRLDFGDLVLNQGIYIARLEVQADGKPAARRTAVFEVVNPRPPRGGRPVLVYPAHFNVTPANP